MLSPRGVDIGGQTEGGQGLASILLILTKHLFGIERAAGASTGISVEPTQMESIHRMIEARLKVVLRARSVEPTQRGSTCFRWMDWRLYAISYGMSIGIGVEVKTLHRMDEVAHTSLVGCGASQHRLRSDLRTEPRWR